MKQKISVRHTLSKALFHQTSASWQTDSKMHLGNVSDIEKSEVRDTSGERSFFFFIEHLLYARQF